MENEVKIEVNNTDEVEIGNRDSVLLKVAGLHASHLLSDINLVVGESYFPAHRGKFPFPVAFTSIFTSFCLVFSDSLGEFRSFPMYAA